MNLQFSSVSLPEDGGDVACEPQSQISKFLEAAQPTDLESCGVAHRLPDTR